MSLIITIRFEMELHVHKTMNIPMAVNIVAVSCYIKNAIMFTVFALLHFQYNKVTNATFTENVALVDFTHLSSL